MKQLNRMSYSSWTFMLASSVFAWAGAAHAQQADDTGSTSARGSEIVVTAQRRAESLEEVPITVNIISNETLANSGIERLEDIGQVSAGTVISRTGIFMQPAIRGVTTAQAAFAENNVAVYVDGFYRPSTRGLNTELANLSQIQVLKGPQGTLFGRNATGGAILIETFDPSMTEQSGHLMASVGNFSDRQIQGYVSAPISDSIAFNFAGSFHESNGYLFDTFLQQNTAPQSLYSLRAKLRIQPSDRLDLLFSVESSKVSDVRSLANTCENYCQSTVVFGDTNVENRPYRTSFSFVPFNVTKDNSISLTAHYDLGAATLNSFSFYQVEKSHYDFDVDLSPRASLSSEGTERWRTFTQEVNLTSNGDGPLQYAVGAYYFRAKQNSPRKSFVSFGTTTINSTTGDIDTEAWALYADGTLRVSDRLYLTLGARYGKETKDAVYLPLDTGFVPVVPPRINADSFTPRAVIRYEISDGSNIYASFSKGFKSGFFNASFPFDPVKPEKITAYEIGFKTARGRFHFDVAAFYYDYKDLQVSSVVIRGTPPVQATITTNAASAEIYGLEMQFSGQLTDRLNIRANAAYTHARYKDYPNATVAVLTSAGLNSSTCPNASPPPATVSCTQDWAGLRMMRAPDWSVNLGADYTIPLASGGEFRLSGNASYESFRLPTKSDIGLNGTGYRYGQPATLLLNLQAAWTPSDTPWTFTVYGNNVTDQKYRYSYAGGSFGDSVGLGAPRTYGVKANYSF